MKLVLKLGIQAHQGLTNDDEVCIPRLSSISRKSRHTVSRLMLIHGGNQRSTLITYTKYLETLRKRNIA